MFHRVKKLCSRAPNITFGMLMRLQVKTKHHCGPKSYFISLILLLKTRTSLALQKIYEIIGVACGLVLLNFGFELLAAGFPGTRQLTSQFLGISLLVGGVVVAFSSLYFLLKSPVQVPALAQPAGGPIGAQEEKQYVPVKQLAGAAPVSVAGGVTLTVAPAYSQILELNIGEFSKSGSSDYERQLAGNVYDMFRIGREGVTVWRENREGMRSNYLAGPYELSMKFMGEYENRGEELKIGHLSVSVEALRDLMRLVEGPA